MKNSARSSWAIPIFALMPLWTSAEVSWIPHSMICICKTIDSDLVSLFPMTRIWFPTACLFVSSNVILTRVNGADDRVGGRHAAGARSARSQEASRGAASSRRRIAQWVSWWVGKTGQVERGFVSDRGEQKAGGGCSRIQLFVSRYNILYHVLQFIFSINVTDFCIKTDTEICNSDIGKTVYHMIQKSTLKFFTVVTYPLKIGP